MRIPQRALFIVVLMMLSFSAFPAFAQDNTCGEGEVSILDLCMVSSDENVAAVTALVEHLNAQSHQAAKYLTVSRNMDRNAMFAELDSETYLPVKLQTANIIHIGCAPVVAQGFEANIAIIKVAEDGFQVRSDAYSDGTGWLVSQNVQPYIFPAAAVRDQLYYIMTEAGCTDYAGSALAETQLVVYCPVANNSDNMEFFLATETSRSVKVKPDGVQKYDTGDIAADVMIDDRHCYLIGAHSDLSFDPEALSAAVTYGVADTVGPDGKTYTIVNPNLPIWGG